MRSRLPWIVLLVSSCVGACTAEPAGDPAAEDLAPIVRSQVRVLDAEPGVDLQLSDSTLTAPRARFPELASAIAGDVLVSGRAAGLLRRVRSIRVDGENIVAETEPASFEDVFDQVHVRGALTGGDALAPAAGQPSATGLAPRGLRFAMPKLSVEQRRLAIGKNSEIELLDGEFEFDPELDFDLRMRAGKVEHIKVLAAGATRARLHVRYHLTKPEDLQSGFFLRFSEGTPLAETPPCYAVFWAGVVPVVVSVRARLLADWELLVGGDVEGEQDVSVGGAASTGLEYVSGGWRNLSSSSLSLSRAGENTLASHSVSGHITLTARLDVSFYELAGPYVGLQAYAGVKHAGTEQASGWALQNGVRGVAGAQVAVFGKSLVGYEAVLFDLHQEHPMR